MYRRPVILKALNDNNNDYDLLKGYQQHRHIYAHTKQRMLTNEEPKIRSLAS